MTMLSALCFQPGPSVGCGLQGYSTITLTFLIAWHFYSYVLSFSYFHFSNFEHLKNIEQNKTTQIKCTPASSAFSLHLSVSVITCSASCSCEANSPGLHQLPSLSLLNSMIAHSFPQPLLWKFSSRIGFSRSAFKSAAMYLLAVKQSKTMDPFDLSYFLAPTALLRKLSQPSAFSVASPHFPHFLGFLFCSPHLSILR